MPEDEEDYVPEEVEQAYKKRKIEIHDVIEADSALAGVDLGGALAVAERTPDLKTKGAVGDEGSPRKCIDTFTLRASTTVEEGAEDDKQHHSTTQLNDGYTGSHSASILSGSDGNKTSEATSPSKHTPKRRLKSTDPQHTSYKPLIDSEESESEGGSSSRRESVRIQMQNGHESKVEEPVQDTRLSTPIYDEISDGSITDSSDGEGSLYSGTFGSTEESTAIVEGAPEEPEVKVDGLEPKPKSDRERSRRMRRIQPGNLAYRPPPSSESEGDVEQLLEQEEMKEHKRRRLKALRKARRTREKKLSLAGGNMVDVDTSIKSRKRKRPSEHVGHELGKTQRKQVEDSVGDSEPKKKRVKKDHQAEMDKSAPITNGVKKSDQTLQVGPIESDLKLMEPLKPLGQEDLKMGSHEPVIPEVPFPIINEKDKSEAGAWWFGRLFQRNRHKPLLTTRRNGDLH